MSNSPTLKSPKKNKKNVLYNDKCSKLEVTLTFNGKTEIIFVDNKKNISTIRDMVYNIFYPIQGKFQLIYKLKDISPFEDIPLYKYFKNLMKISITVNPINPQNFLKDRLLCNDCHTEIITNFCRNCNLFLCKFCSEKYSSPHHDHLIANINVADIEKSAKNYKDIVNKDCFITGKKFEEYKEIFKDIINKYNNNGKEINEENINDNFINNDINSNLENINNMINQDNENNNNKEENKKELDEENNNIENIQEKENNNLENNKENNIKENENTNVINNNKKEKEKRDIRDVDKWLSDMEEKIEKLADSLSKNNGSNSSESNINLRDMENNYDYTYKKVQKINAEKNQKNLESIFNEMHELDLNIRNIDNNLTQCLNNSDANKINGKILKKLNQDLDNTIKKLMKNADIKGKILDNGLKNNI